MRAEAGIRIQRSTERFVTHAEGRTTWHSFSFGTHYDPENLGFGTLVAHNDETLPPGTGYAAHPHRDTEIVTWVLAGTLAHEDAAGIRLLVPGDVLCTSAGSGIVHSERAAPGDGVRFVQTWLRPDEPGGVPSVSALRADGPGLQEVVGPDGLGVGVRGARLLLGDPGTGEMALPDAPFLHLFLVAGEARIGDRALTAGDSARLVGQGGRLLHVPSSAVVSVWAFGHAPGRVDGSTGVD